MINVICAFHRPLPIWTVSQCTRRSLDPIIQWITGIIIFFFNSEFKFLLIHESNFHVTGFTYGFNTPDAIGRVSHTQAASDVAATTTSS
jgi:hypothetical protein